MLKTLFLLAALCLAGQSTMAASSHAVRGHTTKSGKYVQPTRATNPNKSTRDNYSHKGNVNPASGKRGTKN